MSTLRLPWMIGLQADNASAEDRDHFAQQIARHTPDHGDWIFLSTCHRAELYGFGSAPKMDRDIPTHSGDAAVRHLFRVAAGLESAIIGEEEVLHQVREALAHGRTSGALDPRLGRMFETAISVGRFARASRTSTGGNLAQRAIAWLQERAEIAGQSVLVVGAGRMGSILAHVARGAGAKVTIASRNQDRANRLARVYGGRGVDLSEAADVAPRSAAIAIALAGEWIELRRTNLALPPIADISAPPAVPASIRARLNGGFLGIDDLYTASPAVPNAYVENASRIIETKAREFGAWLDRLT